MILVVDDDKPTAQLLKFYLEEIKGKKVFLTHTVRDTLSFLEREKPDIIFLDYLLDTDDARIVIDLVRNKWYIPPKIVIITAMSMPDKIKILTKPDFLIVKPFDLSELDKVINFIENKPS